MYAHTHHHVNIAELQIADPIGSVFLFLFMWLLSHTTELLQIADGGSIFVSFQSILVFQDPKRRQLDEISDPDSHGPAPQFDDNRQKADLGSDILIFFLILFCNLCCVVVQRNKVIDGCSEV